MGHKKRIKLLRLCPLSDFFGLSHAQFNENTINKTRSTILVCDLINKHSHLKSGLSEIEEKDSVLEASRSIYIGDIRGDDDDEADSDQQDENEEEKELDLNVHADGDGDEDEENDHADQREEVDQIED